MTDPMMAVVLAMEEELLVAEIQPLGSLTVVGQSRKGTERVY